MRGDWRRLAATAVTAALLGCCAAGCADGPPPRGPLRIATGGRGGVYYAYGEGLARVVRDHWGPAEVRVLATAASVENIRLVARGQADLAFTLADAAALGVEGRPPFPAPQPVQALARLYDNYVHLVVRADGPVRGLLDLRGRVVSTGAAQSGTELVAARLLGLAGIDPDRDITRHRLGVDESASALRGGRIDAFFWSGGLPTAAIAALARGAPIRLVDLAGHVGDLRERHGEFYTERTIPASAYGLDRAVSTIGVPNYLVVGAAMEEPVAHELTRLLFANAETLAAAHPEALRLNRRAAIGTWPVPLHPGAARYYREAKLAV
jgi:uncharacterized protein